MSHSANPPAWCLRRTDQVAAAALALTAVTVTMIWWAVQGGWQERLIEIDHAEPLSTRFQIDVNDAEEPELLQLPGVGPKMAARIVESRRTAGPFIDPADLRRVRGIGPKTLEKIRPYLRTRSTPG
jgi:competence protein ComEA